MTRRLSFASGSGFPGVSEQELAARLSGFDKQALAGAKAQVNRATLPPDTDLLAAYTEYSQFLQMELLRIRNETTEMP